MKYERIFSIVMLLAMSLLGATGPAAAADPNSAADNTVTVPVSVLKNPNFADFSAQLQVLVNTMGFHTINRFCVVGYGFKGGDDYPLSYIYWPIQNKIIAWPAGASGPFDILVQFSDLTRDILPDGAMTDNYLHRSDLASILKDCWKFGNNYIIKKTAGGWVPVTHYSQFSTLKLQLQDLVDNDAKQKTNTFCVIAQKDGAYLAAYVYWQTADKLIFWLPDKSDADAMTALTNSIFDVDLNHDLRDEADAAYLNDEMQQSYALMAVKSCLKYGQDFTVNKH